MGIKIRYILILILVILHTGCADWLYLEPESELIREEFWQTGDDVEAVVAGTYKELRYLEGPMGPAGILDKYMEVRQIESDGTKATNVIVYCDDPLNDIAVSDKERDNYKYKIENKYL